MAYLGINGRALNAFDVDLAATTTPLRPLWTVSDLDDPEQVEKWFENAVSFCETWYSTHFQIGLDNLLIYRGLQWLNQDRFINQLTDRQVLNNRRSPRVVFNQIMDTVDFWVSKLTRYRPTVAIYPASADSSDADKAEVSKDVLDHIWYQNRIDESNAQLVRLAKIFGGAFRFIDFDPKKGDLHPDYLEASLRGDRIPLLDKEGNPVMSKEGDPIYIQEDVRIGEVDHQVFPEYQVFEEPCNRRPDINWAIRWKTVHVDVLKAEYPEFASQIQADAGMEIFATYNVSSISKGRDDVVVYELWHRNSPFLSRGRYIKRIKGLVLESRELPFSHGQLPYIYLSDIEDPTSIRGTSFIQQCFPIQHQMNAMASLVFKGFVLGAHPKWIAKEGTYNISQLTNEATVVEFSEDFAPQLASYNPVSDQLFRWYDKLEEIYNKVSGQFTLSTGQAPSGVRAAKALRLIEEQEDKRAYRMAIKYNNIVIVDDARKTLAVAADYYEDSDKRVARIVGKNNEFRARQFKVADISGDKDIRIENATSLSQSPAARIEEITEIANLRLPPDSVISREQFIKLSNLGALEELKDVSTRSFSTAKAENDDFRKGLPVAPPTPEEDLIVHWRTHVQEMQGRDFKNLPIERRNAAYEHLYTTEYLMWEKAFGILHPLTMQPVIMPNVVFQQKLMMECQQWPVRFQIPAPGSLPPPPMMSQPQGGMAPQEAPVEQDMQQMPIDTGEPLPNGASTELPPMSVEPVPLFE